MTDFEHPPTQEFRNALDETIWQRIKTARPIELLAPSDDTVLQLVEEPDGRQFVTRSYYYEGVRHVESCGKSFTEAWETMQDIFEQAGIEIVRTGVVKSSDEIPKYPIVMVSEYLKDVKPLVGATTQTKKELVKKLPELFRSSSGLMLSPEVVRADMFKVMPSESGDEQVVLIDTDPLLIKPFMGGDGLVAYYIKRFSELMWDSWCTAEERTEIISEFIKSTAVKLDDKLYADDTLITRAFMNAHLMSQGVDYRELGPRSY